MPSANFSAFFPTAFEDRRQPCRCQKDLAASPCASRLLTIPANFGKTAATLLARPGTASARLSKIENRPSGIPLGSFALPPRHTWRNTTPPHGREMFPRCTSR